MNQREALEALRGWANSNGTALDGWAAQEYLHMVQANVAALLTADKERVITQAIVLEWAVAVTHATITALVAGEKE